MALSSTKLYPYPFKIDTIEDVKEYLKNLYTALVEGDTDRTEDLEWWGQDYWAFKTITGITNDVVADQKGDTLTLSSANAILTIVGTPATDTITFTIDQSQIDHGSLTGLEDDDHLQYIKDSEFTVEAGVLVGTGAGTFEEQYIGTHIQAWDANLDAIGALSDPGADRLLGWIGGGGPADIVWIPASDGIQLNSGNLILDVNGLGEDSGATTGDFLVYYDSTDGVHYKIDFSDLPAAGASYFTASGSDIYFDSGGSVIIGTTAKESNMTEGLTLYQGTNSDHILSLQSSYVAHGFTTRADTDTFGFFKKSSSAAGGLDVWGLSDGNTEGLRLIGLTQVASSVHGASSVAPLEIWGGEKFGTDGSAIGDDDNLAVFVNWGTNVLYVTGDGSLYAIDTGATCKWMLGGDTSCADLTTGIVINQRGVDDALLVFKSTDVAHGITTQAETDTYSKFMKQNATAGGLRIIGYTEGTIAQSIWGVATTDNTTKGAAGTAPVLFSASKKSGTTWGVLGAGANAVVFRNHTTSIFGVLEDGSVWFSGNLFMSTIKSGATQAAAGAAADEVWKTSSHASLPDNVLMIGV